MRRSPPDLALAVFLLPLVAAGCAREREPAPRALDDLAHSVFTDFERPAEFSETVAGLADWLAKNADSEEAWDGLRLTNLRPEEVDGVTVPKGTDLGVHAGVATAAGSPFAVDEHAALLVELDQTWTDPKTFEKYRRTLIEGTREGFAAGSGLVRTDNEIIKSGAFGVVIPYTLRKDYRWVDLEDGTRAVAARTWLEITGCSDNGKNCVLQSWGIEVFHGAEDDLTRRLYAVWLEVRTEADALLSDDGKVALIANGNQDILEATDEELAARR